jgi:hypothetical protein
MSRKKRVFAALVVGAMAALASSASAVTSVPVIVASGSSAMWQTIGLAAYNGGSCTTASVAVHPPCFHYTDNTKFNLNDKRPVSLGGTAAVDTGDIWIVWDSPTGTQKRNVWAYVKVDSVVGNRCFFANPACNITSPSGYVWGTTGSKISSTLWGADTVPPADVQSLFTSAKGLGVNTAATDIRPEDAAFAQCRTNSALGNGVPGFGDGLDGLGYNANNSAGTCPAFGATLSQLVGSPILSGTSTSTANVLAFSISGHDPFTNSAVTAGQTVDVGADALLFVFSRSTTVNTGLKGATNATSSALQAVFSGDNCDATEFGLPTATINVYLREPLSGTMNATEASVFRRPVETIPTQKVLGESQEKGVGAAKLSNTPCSAGGARTRGIGTGEVIADVLASGGTNLDGITYAFFSFGNVKSLSASANYGYLTLDGQDPIGLRSTTQQLPSCTVPCSEASLWGTSGTSFPALRAGNYSAWSLLRMVTNTAHKTSLTDLVNGSHKYVVDDTPDYIPALATTGTSGTDPGLLIFHSHYQQRDGNDGKIGTAPSNGTFSGGNPTGGDKGGDMGGCTISTSGITATTKGNFIQVGPGTTCSSTKLRD